MSAISADGSRRVLRVHLLVLVVLEATGAVFRVRWRGGRAAACERDGCGVAQDVASGPEPIQILLRFERQEVRRPRCASNDAKNTPALHDARGDGVGVRRVARHAFRALHDATSAAASRAGGEVPASNPWFSVFITPPAWA